MGPGQRIGSLDLERAQARTIGLLGADVRPVAGPMPEIHAGAVQTIRPAGRVGGPWDGVIEEAMIGLYKTEVIYHSGLCRNVESAEFETLTRADCLGRPEMSPLPELRGYKTRRCRLRRWP
jgi:hypothetical protein